MFSDLGRNKRQSSDTVYISNKLYQSFSFILWWLKQDGSHFISPSQASNGVFGKLSNPPEPSKISLCIIDWMHMMCIRCTRQLYCLGLCQTSADTPSMAHALFARILRHWAAQIRNDGPQYASEITPRHHGKCNQGTPLVDTQAFW